jgi:hypothetical protein
MNVRLLATLVLQGALVGSACASTFTIAGGTSEAITLTCSPCTGGSGAPVGTTGYESATATIAGTSVLRYEFLGSDATDVNTFFAGSGLNPTFNTTSGSNPSVLLAVTPAQFLSFVFRINSPTGPTLSNGSSALATGPYTGANIFYGIEGSTAAGAGALRSGDVLILALTDGGPGCRPGCVLDNDHQDLTVRISTVPEPSTWALMALGLGMFAFTARRRMRGATAS